MVIPRIWSPGSPGRVRRELTDAEAAGNRHNAAVYEHLADLHCGAAPAGG